VATLPQTCIALTPEHKEKIREYQKEYGATVSATVRVALDRFFASLEKQAAPTASNFSEKGV